MVNVVVEQGRQQIIGHSDCMQVAVEVQVDVLHRNDLRVATASGTTLHTKHRPQRGLAQTDRDILANVLERIAQPYGGSGLTFTGRRRAHRRYQNHARVVAHRLLEQPVEIHFALNAAIGLERFVRNVQRARDLCNRLWGGGLGNFNIGCHG